MKCIECGKTRIQPVPISGAEEWEIYCSYDCFNAAEMRECEGRQLVESRKTRQVENFGLRERLQKATRYRITTGTLVKAIGRGMAEFSSIEAVRDVEYGQADVEKIGRFKSVFRVPRSAKPWHKIEVPNEAIEILA